VDFVAKAVHRAPSGTNAKRILSRGVVPAKEGDLLTRLQIAVRALFRKVPGDLRTGCCRNESKRQGAQEWLH